MLKKILSSLRLIDIQEKAAQLLFSYCRGIVVAGSVDLDIDFKNTFQVFSRLVEIPLSIKNSSQHMERGGNVRVLLRA